MLSPTVIAYVGEPRRSLEVSKVLQRQAGTDLHFLTVAPDEVRPVLTDDRLDGIICGGGLTNDQLQAIVDGVDEEGLDVPLFDLTDAVAAVPSSVEVHHLYATTDPERAAAEMLDIVTPDEGDETEEASDDADTHSTDEVIDEEWTDDERETASEPAADTDDKGELPAKTTLGVDPALTTDEEWQVTGWDPALAGVVTVEDEPAGLPMDEAMPALADQTVRNAGERVAETGQSETVQLQVTDEQWLEVRVIPDDDGLVWFLRDISDSKRYEQDLSEARNRLHSTLDRITDAFFVLDTDEEFVLLNSRAEFVLDVESDEVVGERFWDVFPAAVSTTFYHEFTEAMETQEPTSFEEYYRPLDSWFEVNAYPSEDGLSVFLRDVTEQVRLQRQLEALHETTQELIVAESDREIADGAIEAAVDVLDFPLTVCWRFDETRQRLKPLAWSDAVDDRVDAVQPIEPDSGMAWDAYDENELRVIDSVAIVTPNSHHPGDVDSALLVPLGDYGLLGTYATEESAFDETDTELFRILATAVESAMARALRERQLARRNERLNDFASTVSHDLRNPLHIAAARTELARDTGDLDHLDKVSDALERMETLIEDLLDRARGQQELERETLSLAETARDAWEGVDTKQATLDVAGDATFSADATRLKQLFENLYRNAVEHGSTGSRPKADDAVEHGSTSNRTASDDSVEHGGTDVTVRVGTHDDGFYVGDDGPGIPADERDEVFEQGVSDNEDGTGYGLAIVSEIVEGHGWTVEAIESEEGGACFEIHHVHSLESAESEPV